MKFNLSTAAYATAIGLAGFSGAVATYGLTKLTPGAEVVVGVMGFLFESAKLSSLAMMHRKAMPRWLKLGLAVISFVLMTANIVGVAGMLSNAYTRQQLEAEAANHNGSVIANEAVTDLKRQLEATDKALDAARTALVKARDDKGRVKAAQAVVTSTQSQRDALADKLRTATIAQAKVEAESISAGGEFAAVRFIAQATGAATDTVAHVAILTISSVPDIAAALLLWSAGWQPKVPVARKRKVVKRKAAPKKQEPKLKLVETVA